MGQWRRWVNSRRLVLMPCAQRDGAFNRVPYCRCTGENRQIIATRPLYLADSAREARIDSRKKQSSHQRLTDALFPQPEYTHHTGMQDSRRLHRTRINPPQPPLALYPKWEAIEVPNAYAGLAQETICSRNTGVGSLEPKTTVRST